MVSDITGQSHVFFSSLWSQHQRNIKDKQALLSLQRPVVSPHKGPELQRALSCHDVFMLYVISYRNIKRQDVYVKVEYQSIYEKFNRYLKHENIVKKDKLFHIVRH